MSNIRRFLPILHQAINIFFIFYLKYLSRFREITKKRRKIQIFINDVFCLIGFEYISSDHLSSRYLHIYFFILIKN